MERKVRDRLLEKLRERSKTNQLDANNIDTVVSYLNGLSRIDPEAIGRLIEHRVPCNPELADYPAVQMGEDEEGNPVVGLLEVINGFVGTQPEHGNKPGWGYVAAQFDDKTGKLVGFMRIDK